MKIKEFMLDLLLSIRKLKMKFLYIVRFLIAIVMFLLAILAIWGIFYPVNFLDLQFVPLLQRIFLDFSFGLVVIFFVIILLTLLFGRFYCSTVCPLGILQELLSYVLKIENKPISNYPLKYFISVVVFGILFGGSSVLVRYIEPYTLLSSCLTLSRIGFFVIIIALLTLWIENRFFCTNICPVGTILGLLSKYSLNKIYISDNCLSCGKCEKNCPAGCINSKEKIIDNELCLKCFKCISVCNNSAISFGRKPKIKAKFSLKRRQLVIGSIAFVLFGAMAKTGVILKDKIVEKINEIILPPGAISKQRMANTCYNCNLCVQNCPSKVIVKADKNFPTVHLDYTNGYCKYDCAICAEVCPTGAIKRLTLEDKQKIKIANAIITEENCHQCSLCAKSCPTHAIIKEDGRPPVVDSAKCIGCGACENACKYNAMRVFPISEQKKI